ncbi:MAG: iron ABC transporter permease [Desulfobacteraceae bacterium]|jgi:thiamine transport system permease protein
MAPSPPGRRLLFILPPLLFLGLFYFYPLARIFTVSFFPGDLWAPLEPGKLLTSGYHLGRLWFTFWQAAVSTLLTLVLALPGAWLMARYDFRGRAALQTLATIPFVLPTVVVASAFQALLGPHGLVNTGLVAIFDLPAPPVRMHHSVGMILAAHVFYNYAVVLRIVGGFWAQLAPEINEAARMLGASGWQAFRRVTLPLLQPAILAAALLVFMFCFSSFGVVLILGGPRLATIEVEIYRQAIHLFNLPLAAALSLVQILFTFGLMLAYTGLQRRSAPALMPAAPAVARRVVQTVGERLFLGLGLLPAVLFLSAPLVALLLQSFATESGLGLAFYRALWENPSQSLFFVPPLHAIGYSVGFALTALLLAVAVGLPAALFLAGPPSRLSALLDPLFMLPLSTSAVTLGFGFIIALDRPPLNLRNSPWLVPAAHCLVAFPFVLRSLLPALRSIPESLREAATLLGASPRQVWTSVDLPIIGRALLVGMVFAFTVSMGEFGATSLVARPQTPTMPLAIFRFLGQPGALNYGQAMAMSSLLMVVTAAGFVVLEKLRPQTSGGF